MGMSYFDAFDKEPYKAYVNDFLKQTTAVKPNLS